jgi:3-hydroxybutyryl-CoA dehydrogenase
MNTDIKIGIVGSGAMGSGIAQVAATAGHQVIVVDSSKEAISRSKTNIENSLHKFEAKGKLSDKAEAVLSRIKYAENLKDLGSCHLIIEAVVEDLEIKKRIFNELEDIVDQSCILASNTSSLSIASLARDSKHPERIIGIHFFNPAVLMPLVEVVPSISTHKKVMNDVIEILSNWNKVLVTAKDTPGFIVNRVARPFYSEALRIYEEGMATFSQIDAAMRSIGFKMGPFELMDYIGHDVNYKVTTTVWEQMFYDPRYKPSLVQKRLFESGFYGRKSGRGYYEYQDGKQVTVASDVSEEFVKEITERVLAMLINEAADALYYQIATAKDIDLAMTKGVNYPKGLLKWADEWGVKNVMKVLNDLYQNYCEERYRPSVLLRKMERENRTFY